MIAFYSCESKSAPDKKVDTRCPELVAKAEYYNAQYANGSKSVPKGMSVKVEYVDSVYRIIQIVDESVIPIENIKRFYGNMRPNMIASLAASKGKERDEYLKMVDYCVTFEHIVISKNSGDVIVRTTFSPENIAEALSYNLSRKDELMISIHSIKQTLPRPMIRGYIMNDISYSENNVHIEIIVDGIDFSEISAITDKEKKVQAVVLADLTTGLTFHRIASSVPIGIYYHLVSPKRDKRKDIIFTADEVVKYNEVMEMMK